MCFLTAISLLASPAPKSTARSYYLTVDTGLRSEILENTGLDLLKLLRQFGPYPFLHFLVLQQRRAPRKYLVSSPSILGKTRCKDLLSDRTIIQVLSMRLLSTLNGIDGRPTAHLGRASEDGTEDLEDEELQTRPFTHDFRDDPAWV